MQINAQHVIVTLVKTYVLHNACRTSRRMGFRNHCETYSTLLKSFNLEILAYAILLDLAPRAAKRDEGEKKIPDSDNVEATTWK